MSNKNDNDKENKRKDKIKSIIINNINSIREYNVIGVADNKESM